MPERPNRFALVGPPRERPCGILDYSLGLLEALNSLEPVSYLTYTESEQGDGLSQYEGALVQYESSLVPNSHYLKRLNSKYPGKIYTVPHEVYREDPFAYPIEELESRWDWLLRIKQTIYQWRHREYLAEKKIQQNGYYSRKTIPLSTHTSKILGEIGAANLTDPVPHAFERKLNLKNPPRSALSAWRAKLFTAPPKFLLGIFGFLNPAMDYEIVFSALKQGPDEVGLLLLGGDRGGAQLEETLRSKILTESLMDRVKISGYVEEKDLPNALSMCDAFICPFRFKSNSGSIMKLFTMNRPILASSLPLTHELKSMGAPISLYRTKENIISFCEEGLNGELEVLDNRYGYDYPTVVQMYLKIMSSTG